MNTRRPFLIAFALLLAVSSIGHVFAAAFCPRLHGRECCVAKTVKFPPTSSCSHQDPTDGRPMNHMNMDGMHDMSTMDGMVMSESGSDDRSAPPVSSSDHAGTLADVLEQPVELCPHCMSHSGFPNAPVSSVNVPDESRKAVDDPVPLSASSFLAPSVVTVAARGLPREHAPPGTIAPRHILNNVFLI